MPVPQMSSQQEDRLRAFHALRDRSWLSEDHDDFYTMCLVKLHEPVVVKLILAAAARSDNELKHVVEVVLHSVTGQWNSGHRTGQGGK